jgi:hypothetical protein
MLLVDAHLPRALTMSQTVAVLDVGKTNVKLALFDDGRLL